MQARRYVEAPAGRPLPFGLLSVALVNPDNDEHLGMGVEYETTACRPAHRTQDQCVADLESQDTLFAEDGQDLIRGDAFYAYALHTCRPVGGGVASVETNARARLAAGLGHAVEEGFYDSLSFATDLTPTPGTALHPMAGLALLEEYAARNYNGTPVLHVNRGTGTLLTQMGAVDRYGPRLETKQGVPVASGGGYTSNATVVDQSISNGPETHWMRITGAVVVRTGEVQSYPAMLRRADSGDEEPVPGRGDYVNEVAAFAQQPVVVTAECLDVAVLVTSPRDFYASLTDGGAP